MTRFSATAFLAALLLSFPVQAADKKGRGKLADLDPKSLLLKLVLRADKDGDGSLSIQEFHKLPAMREVKKEKLDRLFATIDANSNGALSTEEVGKGVDKITELAKAERSSGKDANSTSRAKKLKRLVKKA